MTKATRFLEDFNAGDVIVSRPYAVTRDEILRFAAEFDPQPFHLDDDAAAASLLGGLAASGWHTCAIGMRLVFDSFLHDSASLGSPGVDAVRWLKPVRPGDRLTLETRVVAVRPSRSRPDRGIVTFSFTLANQAGEPVMTQDNSILIRARGAGQAA